MNKDYRQLLEGCDEDGAYEFPVEFDYDALERDALIVERELQNQLDLKTKFEGAVFNQDASFSIAIILLDYTQKRGNIIYQPTIRFSNFGRLCTLTFAEMIPADISGKIPAALEAGGFHYIPQGVLDTDYDGVMAGNKALPTWWIRYLDWV